MKFMRVDDHYNQDRYRNSDKFDEGRCHIFRAREGQKVNFPFWFNREAGRPLFSFTGQPRHRGEWYKECNLMIGGR